MSENYRGVTLLQQGDAAPWGSSNNTAMKAIIDKTLDSDLIMNTRHFAYVTGLGNGNYYTAMGMGWTQNSTFVEDIDPYVPSIGLGGSDPGDSAFGSAFEVSAGPFCRTIVSSSGPGFDIQFEFRELASLVTQTTLVGLGTKDAGIGNADPTAQIASYGSFGLIGVGWDATDPTIGIYVNATNLGSPTPAPTRLAGAGTSAARTTDLLNVRFKCNPGSTNVTVIVTNVTLGTELINYEILEASGVPVDLRLGCRIDTTQGTSGVQNPVALYKITKVIYY